LQRDKWILNSSFPLAGTITTYLGTLLPILVARWSLSDAQAGQLFTAQFVGAMAGSLSQGWITGHWGAARCVAIGYLLMALGTAGIASGGLNAGLAAIFCAGVGIGWSVPGSNWLAAKYSSDDPGRAINALNAAWCAGAVVGPALIARALLWIGLLPTLLVVSAILVIVTIAAWTLKDVEEPADLEASGGNSRRRVRNLAFVAAAVLFLYVGFETGISGWTPSLALRELKANQADAALAQTAFWAAVLVTRVTVSFTALSRWIGMRSLVAGLSSAAIGVVCMTTTHDRVVLGLGVILAGMGCATIFPTVVSLFQMRAGAGSETWLGFIIAAGSCGASLIPWLIGASSTWFGGLAWSMITILLAACAGMGLLLPAMREQKRF
jgi:fucose permease